MHRRTALTPFELFSGANAGAPLSGLLADVKDIMSFGAGGIRYQGTADPAPTFDAPRPVLPPISPVLHMLDWWHSTSNQPPEISFRPMCSWRQVPSASSSKRRTSRNSQRRW